MLKDRKIIDWTQPVSSLADRPQMTAAALKAAFDSNTNQVKPALNGVIDDLTGTDGATNIGTSPIDGVTGTDVQTMLAFLKGLIDLRDPTENVDQKLALKADKAVTDKHVKTVNFDGKTGVFTFISEDGTSQTLDTMLEKVPVRCYLDGQTFVLVLEDGTEQRADLSAFLTETEFVNSETIDFAISDGSVRASVKAGSITLAMLESTAVSTLQGYMTAAQTAAENAKASETNAAEYRDAAAASETAAAQSASESRGQAAAAKSWAVGGTATRPGEDTDNAKYYAERSKESASTAQGWSDTAMGHKDAAESSAIRAEQAAKDAEAIVGGDFIPNSQKGVPNGVASLNAQGKLKAEQKPVYTADEIGAVPQTRTINKKPLSTDVTLTGEDIKVTGSDETTIHTRLSEITNPNLLDNWYFVGGGETGQFPINQRGRTEYTGDVYGIDRWRGIYGGEKVTLKNSWSSFEFSGNQGVKQEFDKDVLTAISGNYCTISIIWRLFSGSYANFGVVVNGEAKLIPPIVVSENFVLTSLTLDLSAVSALSGYMSISGDGVIDAIACKLEVGRVQTLAHQENGKWVLNEIPDYGEQLAKCQRYYCTSYQNGPVGTPEKYLNEIVMTAISQINFSTREIQFPQTMRTTPVITFYSPVTGNVGKAAKARGGEVDIKEIIGGKNRMSFFCPSNNLDIGYEYYVHYSASADL